MSQRSLPNYNLILYDIGDMDIEGYSRLIYFVRLVHRYPQNQLKELYDWFKSLSESQVRLLGLRVASDELSMKSYRIIAIEEYHNIYTYRTFSLHQYPLDKE